MTSSTVSPVLRHAAAALLLCFAAPVAAVPADPTPHEVTQPDGTRFVVILRGDEYQHWIETREGYSIVRNPRSGYWEYAAKDKQRKLVPSGKQVDPAVAPLKSLRQHLMPGRASVLDAGATRIPRRDSHGSSPSGGFVVKKWTRRYLGPSRNLLVILVGFNNRALATTASDWATAVFDATPNARSVGNYYKDNSYGHFAFTPVAHTQPGGPPGVVAVSIAQPYPDFSDVVSIMNFFNDSLAAAAQFVNFGSFDRNGDGAFTNDELNIYFILAGYEASDPTSPMPSVWSMHASVDPGTPLYDKISAGGIKLREWSQTGELDGSNQRLAIGTLVHELGHSLGLPDLYDTSYWYGNSNPNEGIGIFSPMANGHNGTDHYGDHDHFGSVPVALDAWSREFLGWGKPRIPSGCGNLPFAPALDADDAAVKLTNPDINPDEYFQVENRFPKSWDEGLKYWHGDNWPGGLLVLHIDNGIDVGASAIHDINRQIAGSHQGVMPVDACSPAYTGDICRLFYAGNNANLDETTTPNSNFYSAAHPDQLSVITYLGLHNVSAPSANMTADLAPSYAVATSAIGPGRVRLNPAHANRVYSCTNVEFTASPLRTPGLHATFDHWDGDAPDRTMNPFTLLVDSPLSVVGYFLPRKVTADLPMKELEATCSIVGCPPFPVLGDEWIVKPFPSDAFRAVLYGVDREAATKAADIRKEASRLAKGMERASREQQAKSEKRAAALMKALAQIGVQN